MRTIELSLPDWCIDPLPIMPCSPAIMPCPWCIWWFMVGGAVDVMGIVWVMG